MTRVRVAGFTISLDGYGAGPNQHIRNPPGVGGGERLFEGIDARVGIRMRSVRCVGESHPCCTPAPRASRVKSFARIIGLG